MHIIDITKKDDKKRFPPSLHGEVFLEETLDDSGKKTGFITTTVEEFNRRKALPLDHPERKDWSQYEHLLSAP